MNILGKYVCTHKSVQREKECPSPYFHRGGGATNAAVDLTDGRTDGEGGGRGRRMGDKNESRNPISILCQCAQNTVLARAEGSGRTETNISTITCCARFSLSEKKSKLGARA